MAIPRQKFREIVLQILFCSEFKATSMEDLIPLLMGEHRVAKSIVREATAMAEQVFKSAGPLDGWIEKHSLAYGLERITSAERAILRLAVFEMLLATPKIPPKVAITEAVRLTRKFATRDSARFVNAVLDAIYKESESASAAPALPCRG